jgi:hypothetical protein
VVGRSRSLRLCQVTGASSQNALRKRLLTQLYSKPSLEKLLTSDEIGIEIVKVGGFVEYVFVADTNLFFECKKLEDLPWGELGVDPVCIDLTKPVLAEIDKHKKGAGRTKKRAIEIFNRVREMLDRDKDEVVIREESPRVILRLSPALKPDPDQAEVLDYTIVDDRIIGTALAISKGSQKVAVSFLTDDGGAAATARTVGLPYKLIPATWKRPPRQTTEAKKILELEKDLAVYRAQEPVIEVRDLSEVSPTATERRVAKPLPTSTIDQLMQSLETRCPPHDDWSVPTDAVRPDGAKITFEPASAEAIQRYSLEEYPEWLEACRDVFERLHEGQIEWEDDLTVSFGVSNVGNRPAINMKVAFEARGDVQIKRPSSDDDLLTVRKERKTAQPLPSLPKPPKPPEPTRKVVMPSKPSNKSAPSVPLLSRNKALLAAQGLSSFSRAGELGLLGGLDQSAIDRVLGTNRGIDRLMREHSEIQGLASQFAADTDRFDAGRELLSHSISPPYVPPTHDPEAFYANDWDRFTPSQTGAYVCDLFRHRREEETFDLELLFPEDAVAKGVVICSVHAENLTEPVELRIPVSRSIDQADLMEQAEALVEACANS